MPQFHYTLRPAKHVERLMITEAARSLANIAPLPTYSYVGFGALEFVDFDLIHRTLGISKMTSIECDLSNPRRYEFNRPFRGIDLLFGRASQHLPALDWSGLRIVWLDYEGQLTREFVRDIETVARVILPGSLLIVTLGAGAKYGSRLPTLTENVGIERVPVDLTETDLDGPWSFAAAQRTIATSALDEVLSVRLDQACAQQIFNFVYADSARMQTVGWLITAPALTQVVTSCRFDDHDFVRAGDTPLELKVPVLTRREIARLNLKLPASRSARLRENWIDQQTQSDYAQIYRYYPSFL